MSLFIGIDSGTQSTKGLVLDLQGRRIVAEAQAPHELIAGLPPGHMEQHPQSWITALDRVMEALSAKIERARVHGIGISGQQHGFVPLDDRGEVIRAAKLWCDTSTVAECQWLTRKLGGAAAVIRRTGLLFLPGYTAPKILWLKRHEPRSYRKLRHVLLPHDYLNFYLTGRYFMEAGDASGTALMDVRRRRWSDRVVRAIDPNLQEWLPAISGSHETPGTLRPEIARRYGLSPEVMVSAGGGDNMMGAIGTGNVKAGVVTASLGTSGTIYAFSARPAVDARGEVAAFCDSTGGWLSLVCTMNVTLVTEAFRDLFGWTHEQFDAAVASTPAGAHGLRLLPYFIGERTPNLPDATGTLSGLTPRTLTRGHLARAAVEGVLHGIAYGLERLRTLGIRTREIRLTGGAARSAVWRQVMADAFGVPVVKMASDESAALGAAIQAAWCLRSSERPGTPIDELTHQLVAVDESARCLPAASRNPRRGRRAGRRSAGVRVTGAVMA